jgi:hypothetical protein
MEHEPCGFLSDVKVAGYLIAAYPVLAIGEHPNRSKPLIKADGGVLKNCSDLYRKFPLRMMGGTLPCAALRIERANPVRTTCRAGHAFRPATGRQVFNAVVNTREIKNGFLQAFGFFFHLSSLHLKKYTTNEWTSQVH